MKFDIGRIKKASEEDYEGAWEDSKDLIKKEGRYFSLKSEGSSHPLFDLVQEFRSNLIDLGFQETVIPALIQKDEVRKQYGPEAPVILDRVFFLAGLDRSDLGIGKNDIDKIQEEVPGFSKSEELEDILRRYKEGKISSDDLMEVFVRELDLGEKEAAHILSLFEDFKELEPVPSDMTLRSHTTAGWFPVLRDMKDRKSLPIQLFTVGPKYRREQELDETHLYRSWTASLVVMAEEFSIEDGKNLATEVLEKMGFDDVEFEMKKATSKYYAPESEFEIFVTHPGTGERVEIGNAGHYSPVSLASYGISRPVFNLGVGLERILMIRTGEEDIRELVYPYKYKDLDFSDEEISERLDFEKKPETEYGRAIAEEIRELAEKKKDEPSPCEFELSPIEIDGKKVIARLVEPEENTNLIGPAAFNTIYVVDGNIIGVPPSGWEDNDFLRKAREEGVSTGISYIGGFANLAARVVEEAIKEGKKEVELRIPMVESLGDINLRIDKPVRRYITNNNKRIDIRGPVFTTLRAEIG